MAKRKAGESEKHLSAAKRPKLLEDRLSTLSDELILRILSYLPVEVLALCQAISKSFKSIAGDGQLWKQAYYDDFVWPRAVRLYRKNSLDSTIVKMPSRLAKWLDEDVLVRNEPRTDWKHQYKLRYRWATGLCDLEEIPVSRQSFTPPLVARMLDGLVYSVDYAHGLRVWAYKDEKRLLTEKSFTDVTDQHPPKIPLSIAVSYADEVQDAHDLAVGFQDGSFSIYRLDTRSFHLSMLWSHACSSQGPISCIATLWPYLLTLASNQTLSLYYFRRANYPSPTLKDQNSPILLSSLTSQTLRSPLSLSLRKVQRSIWASIAFAVPSATSGWSTGIQELRFSEDGNLQLSRIVSASTSSRWGNDRSNVILPEPRLSQPTSISYSHPYLLMSHPDNTLTLYLVTSTTNSLKVSSGTRLWGHTSAVFDAHVGSRGKAVSVSSKGEEIRVWELEGAATGQDLAHAAEAEHNSVQLTPGNRTRTLALGELSQAISSGGGGCSAGASQTAPSVTRGWVGFDEENVVVLMERSRGNQTLAVYDFS